jgi:hypothetical protein
MRPKRKADDLNSGRAASGASADDSNSGFQFTAKIIRSGTEYCVDVPLAVTRAVGARGRVPVAVRVGKGFPFHATFRPTGDGRHQLFLNAEARAGAKIGARVEIEAKPVSANREVPIPPDLAKALHEADVLEAWSSFPPGKREHILRWIEEAVHEETRIKRIAKAIEVTEKRRERRLSKSQ